MKSVLVIGGGVVGLCSAFYAAQRGLRVTLLERGAPDHDSCSLGNAGMVVPSHFVPLAAPGMVATGLKMMFNPESPFYLRPRLDRDLLDWAWKFWRAATREHVERSAPLLRDLNLASRRCFEELAELPGNDFGLVRKGLLMLCRTEHGLAAESKLAAQARALTVPAEMLTPAETTRLEPALRMDIAGAVYFPKDCHLSPPRFMAGITRWLEHNGVNIVWNTEVKGWRMNASRIVGVQAGGREFSADEYVLAGGAWSAALARQAGLRLPMQAGKGYSLTLAQPKRLPTLCSILVEARATCTPMDTALRFAGTMEITGLDESVNPRRVRGLIQSICQFLPEFSPQDFANAPVWRGLRPCSPDGLPYLGRSRRQHNLIVATGHAMMGLSLGPITGKIVAELAAGEQLSFALGLLNPERYQRD